MATDDRIVSGVAGRYALALFELALEQNNLASVENDLSRVQALLDESEDLRRVVRSPVFAASEQANGVIAVLRAAEVGETTSNVVQLLARNRRLFVLSDVIRGFRGLAARHRGEVTAEVTSAYALSDEQTSVLKETLRVSAGQDVALAAKVDPNILGGLIVKIGSRMVDSSLRTKLSNMKAVLKNAG